MPKISTIFRSKTPTGWLTAHPRPPAVLRTVYGSAKIKCAKIKNIVPFSMYLTLPLFCKIGPGCGTLWYANYTFDESVFPIAIVVQKF